MGVFHETMVQALARQGLEVTVIAPAPALSRAGRPPPRGSLSARAGDNGVAVFRPRYLAVPRQNTFGIAHWLMQAALGGINFSRYDLIHAHFGYPMGLLADFVKRGWNIPSVLTLHGSDVNVHPEGGPRQRKQFQKAVFQSDKVLAVSEALAKRTFELVGLEPEVLRTGINMERFQRQLSTEAARRKLGLPLDSFLVLYVGNFIKAKGIRELLQALSRYKNERVKGVFAGSGPLDAEIRKLDNSIVLGAIPNEQIPTIMSAADVFVLPSHREGLGTVLVEAGALGLPVVATRVGGIPEVVSDDTGILIEPRSAEHLYEALGEVRRHYLAALERAEALKAFVHSHYDVDENARKLKQIYTQVARSRV